MQLTSATATTFNEVHWKRLRILPGQTVIESAALDFPAVRAETRFMVQWIENTNRVIGTTEVFVYPSNLLAELQPLVGHEDGALGVFDPQDQFKPLLRDAKVNFIDLGNAVLENFRGKLAIIGPFESKAKMDSTLSSRIKTITEKGVALVWIQPPGGSSNTCAEQEFLRPSFYSVPENQIAAVLVQPELVANPADDPCSQLNLIYFCKLALHPEPLTFPSTKTQP